MGFMSTDNNTVPITETVIHLHNGPLSLPSCPFRVTNVSPNTWIIIHPMPAPPPHTGSLNSHIWSSLSQTSPVQRASLLHINECFFLVITIIIIDRVSSCYLSAPSFALEL